MTTLLKHSDVAQRTEYRFLLRILNRFLIQLEVTWNKLGQKLSIFDI